MSTAPRHAARSTPAKVVSLPVPAPTTPTPPILVAVPDDDAPDDSASPVSAFADRMSANQLLEESRVEPELLNKILSLGLLTPSSHDGDVAFSTHDIVIVQAAAALLRGGADPRLLGALRRVVERQVGIIDDLTADLRGGTSTSSEVTFVRREVAGDVEALRAALFERELSDFLNR